MITPKGGFSFGSGATDYGSTGQVLKSNGDAPPTFGSTITARIAVPYTSFTTSTYNDFTDIPPWVKRITVMFDGLSFNTTGFSLIQVGTGGSPQISEYLSTGFSYNSFPAQSATNGFVADQSSANAVTRHGHMTICNMTGNTWTYSGVILAGASAAKFVQCSAGVVTLGGVLDMIRITSNTGTATFDAGTINILYE